MCTNTASLVIHRVLINNWNSPNITQYTPWLNERIDYLQAQDPNQSSPITLVLCCNDSIADTSAAQMLAMGCYTVLEPTVWFYGQKFIPDGFDDDTDIGNSPNSHLLVQIH